MTILFHQIVHEKKKTTEEEALREFSQSQVQDAATENFIGSVLSNLGLTLEGVVVHPKYT